MKKFTRIKRKFLIEKGKTIVLVLLCVCCVYLFSRVVNLYNRQINIGGNFWTQDETKLADTSGIENAAGNFWNMAAPDTIMVEYSDGKYIFDDSDENYAELLDLTKTVIKNLYFKSAESFIKRDETDWINAMQGNVMYVRFPCSHITAFEGPVLSAATSSFSQLVNSYSELLLIFDSKNDGMKIMVRAEDTGEVFEIDNKTSSVLLNETVKGLAETDNNNCVFARELNLDKENSHGVTLAPTFLIPLEDVVVNDIVLSVPSEYKAGISVTQTTEFAVNLINAFGYNPNAIRQYADSEGKLIFVSETGTIGIHPNGTVEYKALGENDGIKLISTVGSASEPTSVVAEIANLNYSILNISDVENYGKSASLRFVQFPETDASVINIKMDYYANNRRIRIGNTPAVEAIIKNGILVEYRIKVKNIKTLPDKTVVANITDAVDAFCDENPQCKKITAGCLVYKVVEDDKPVSAVWEIEGE